MFRPALIASIPVTARRQYLLAAPRRKIFAVLMQYSTRQKNFRLQQKSGFSLLELLIAMTLLGIIASIAVPAWRQQLLAAHRSEAVALLMQLSTRQEQFRVQQQRYADQDETVAAPPAGLGMLLPADRYQLTVTADISSYTATATVNPLGPQSADSRCWRLAIDATGRRWAENQAGEDSTSVCWRR